MDRSYQGEEEFFAVIRIDQNLGITEVLSCGTVLSGVASDFRTFSKSNNPIIRTVRLVKLVVTEVIEGVEETRNDANG